MFPIVNKEVLNEQVIRMDILAPLIASKAQPGNFVMIRVDETGERIPLTVFDCDDKTGIVSIIFQTVGATTKRLGQKSEKETVLDFVGPLGNAAQLDGFKKAVIVAGGLGSAVAYPMAKKLKQNGVQLVSILGFRSNSLIILDEYFRSICNETYVMTDDGTNGNKGFVTAKLIDILDKQQDFDLCVSVGPMRMMKAVCDITRPFGIHTKVSLNSIMVDGTGMCGSCRVNVGGEIKFTCLHGPEFDGHLVDFDDAIKRT